jgi:tungstate transport system permease protein
MDVLFEALTDAVHLLGSLDAELLTVVGLTLRVTGSALLLAMLIGIPAGAILGLKWRIPGGGCLVPLIYIGMGLPPVVVGLHGQGVKGMDKLPATKEPPHNHGSGTFV